MELDGIRRSWETNPYPDPKSNLSWLRQTQNKIENSSNEQHPTIKTRINNRYVSKAFDADAIIAASGGIGLIASDAQQPDQVNIGGPAVAVYDHKLCFNWGEDAANGLYPCACMQHPKPSLLRVYWSSSFHPLNECEHTLVLCCYS